LSSPKATDELGADEPEPRAHSFIVKVWVEEEQLKTGRVTWRGHITHVFSGKRRYLKDLDDITLFIAPHLQAMGVKLSQRVRLKTFLKRH